MCGRDCTGCVYCRTEKIQDQLDDRDNEVTALRAALQSWVDVMALLSSEPDDLAAQIREQFHGKRLKQSLAALAIGADKATPKRDYRKHKDDCPAKGDEQLDPCSCGLAEKRLSEAEAAVFTEHPVDSLISGVRVARMVLATGKGE